MSIAGIVAILAIAFLLSTNRKAIRLRVVRAAFALQAVIAWLVLWTSWGRAGIQSLSNGVANLLGYANKGTEFLFGPSATNPLANTFATGSLAACGANWSTARASRALRPLMSSTTRRTFIGVSRT